MSLEMQSNLCECFGGKELRSCADSGKGVAAPIIYRSRTGETLVVSIKHSSAHQRDLTTGLISSFSSCLSISFNQITSVRVKRLS